MPVDTAKLNLARRRMVERGYSEDDMINTSLSLWEKLVRAELPKGLSEEDLLSARLNFVSSMVGKPVQLPKGFGRPEVKKKALNLFRQSPGTAAAKVFGPTVLGAREGLENLAGLAHKVLSPVTKAVTGKPLYSKEKAAEETEALRTLLESHGALEGGAAGAGEFVGKMLPAALSGAAGVSGARALAPKILSKGAPGAAITGAGAGAAGELAFDPTLEGAGRGAKYGALISGGLASLFPVAKGIAGFGKGIRQGYKAKDIKLPPLKKPPPTSPGAEIPTPEELSEILFKKPALDPKTGESTLTVFEMQEIVRYTDQLSATQAAIRQAEKAAEKAAKAKRKVVTKGTEAATRSDLKLQERASIQLAKQEGIRRQKELTRYRKLTGNVPEGEDLLKIRRGQTVEQILGSDTISALEIAKATRRGQQAKRIKTQMIKEENPMAVAAVDTAAEIHQQMPGPKALVKFAPEIELTSATDAGGELLLHFTREQMSGRAVTEATLKEMLSDYNVVISQLRGGGGVSRHENFFKVTFYDQKGTGKIDYKAATKAIKEVFGGEQRHYQGLEAAMTARKGIRTEPKVVSVPTAAGPSGLSNVIPKFNGRLANLGPRLSDLERSMLSENELIDIATERFSEDVTSFVRGRSQEYLAKYSVGPRAKSVMDQIKRGDFSKPFKPAAAPTGREIKAGASAVPKSEHPVYGSIVEAAGDSKFITMDKLKQHLGKNLGKDADVNDIADAYLYLGDRGISIVDRAAGVTRVPPTAMGPKTASVAQTSVARETARRSAVRSSQESTHPPIIEEKLALFEELSGGMEASDDILHRIYSGESIDEIVQDLLSGQGI